MPSKAKNTATPRTDSGIDSRELATLIREAVRAEMSEQHSRTQTTTSYVKRLEETDAKVTDFIQQAINETTRAYRLSVDALFVGYLSAFFTLVIGLLLVIFYADHLELFTIAVLFVAIGVIWIIRLQNRNLSKNFRSLIDNLAKLNIIFASYIRQIHQVDVVFEKYVGSSSGLTIQDAEQLLNNLQDTMVEAIAAVTSFSGDADGS